MECNLTGSINTLDDHFRTMNLGMKMFLIPNYHRFRRQFLKIASVADGDIILDFGCGVGLLEDLLAPRLCGSGRIVGVDIGENLIRKARNRFAGRKEISFSVIDPVGKLPFKSESFSLIVSNLVSHLLNRGQKEAVYSEFRRILKPDGRVIMAEFGKPASWYGKWNMFLAEQVWSRIWPYESNSIDSYKGRIPDFLKTAGMDNVEIVGGLGGYIDFIVCTKS